MRAVSGFFWALGGLACGVGLGAAVRNARARARPHEALEANFHAAYGRTRANSARVGPVLVLIDGTLVLMHGSERLELAASDPATRILQAAAHAPIGIFAVLCELSPRTPLGPAAVMRLSELRTASLHAREALGPFEAAVRSDLEDVLERSRRFIEAQLQHGAADAQALASFAREIGPRLLVLIDHATQLELKALHAAAENALARLDADALRELEVVVAGAHQARARSLGMQYFTKRFGEAPGEERRIAYAESAQDVEAARALVGTRRLDRAIARAFFGDPKRLQRDVLGDAAKSALEHIELPTVAPN
jgi:hypothetical protein